VKIFKKPAIIVKTKKGKRYLQIRTVQNNLIHIGPASDPENWLVAFTALQEEYEMLFLEERMSFAPYMFAEKAFPSAISIGKNHEKWRAYRKKVEKKIDEHEQWLRETEKEFNCKMSRDPFYNNWYEMLDSKAAKNDPELMKAIKILLKS
jgi:hypothetical protein